MGTEIMVLICVLIVAGVVNCLLGLIITKLAEKKYMLVINNDVKYFEFYSQVLDYIRLKSINEVLSYQLFTRENGKYIFLTDEIKD